MKKEPAVKKLKLHRQTLLQLTPEHMEKVEGGTIVVATDACPTRPNGALCTGQ